MEFVPNNIITLLQFFFFMVRIDTFKIYYSYIVRDYFNCNKNSYSIYNICYLYYCCFQYKFSQKSTLNNGYSRNTIRKKNTCMSYKFFSIRATRYHDK